jgi:hypothetical protein
VSRLDWNDPEAVRLWLHGVRVSFSDFDAVASDMLRPKHLRRLGHQTHKSMYRAARAQLRMALDYATPEKPPPQYPGPSDPAGCGGSPGE